MKSAVPAASIGSRLLRFATKCSYHNMTYLYIYLYIYICLTHKCTFLWGKWTHARTTSRKGQTPVKTPGRRAGWWNSECVGGGTLYFTKQKHGKYTYLSYKCITVWTNARTQTYMCTYMSIHMCVSNPVPGILVWDPCQGFLKLKPPWVPVRAQQNGHGIVQATAQQKTKKGKKEAQKDGYVTDANCPV